MKNKSHKSIINSKIPSTDTWRTLIDFFPQKPFRCDIFVLCSLSNQVRILLCYSQNHIPTIWKLANRAVDSDNFVFLKTTSSFVNR